MTHFGWARGALILLLILNHLNSFHAFPVPGYLVATSGIYLQQSLLAVTFMRLIVERNHALITVTQ
jgi:hypothetical protein